MAIHRKISPTGVDKLVDKLQVIIFDGLTNRGWTGYESYHRAYKNDKTDNVTPERFEKDNNYKGVLMNDDFTVTSFFLVPSPRPVEGGLVQCTISIIFQANLKKLYPTSPNTQRFDEEFINDVSVVVHNLGGQFEFADIFTEIDDVYEGFDTDKIKARGDNMEKFGVIRVDLEANYQPFCGDVYASSGAMCTIAPITVSTEPPTSFGGSNGTAEADATGVVNGTLSYLWDAAAGNQTTKIATGLVAGDYTVAVTDSIPDECTREGTGTVEQGAQSELTDFPESIIIWDGRVNTNFNGGGITDGTPVSEIASVLPATVSAFELTPTKQPTYFEDDFGSEDKPQWRHTTNHMLESNYSTSGPLTIICALNIITSDSNTRYIFSGTSLATSIHIKYRSGTLRLRTEGADIIGPVITTGRVIVKCIIDGANSKFGINLDAYTSANVVSSEIDNLTFGGHDGGVFVNGSMDAKTGIFGCVEKALTETELDTMVSTYATQFGITV